jgi:hypothetical protein
MKRLSRRDRVLSSHSLGQTRTSSLGAARPLPPSADIGSGGPVQSVDQPMHLECDIRLFPHVEAPTN